MSLQSITKITGTVSKVSERPDRPNIIENIIVYELRQGIKHTRDMLLYLNIIPSYFRNTMVHWLYLEFLLYFIIFLYYIESLYLDYPSKGLKTWHYYL